MTAPATPQAQPRVNPLSHQELFQVEGLLIVQRSSIMRRAHLEPAQADAAAALDHVNRLINRVAEVRRTTAHA